MAPNSSALTELGEMYLTYRPMAAAAAQGAAAAGAGQQQSRGSSEAGGFSEGAAEGGEEAAAGAPSSPGASWSELCATCIQHLQQGRPLAALPAAQRTHCSLRCGFWPRSPGPTGRTATAAASLSSV